MNYRHGTLIGGEFTVGTDPSWEWARNGGCYSESRDFFSVHWEVQAHDPASVRLHVEAPRASVDGSLNAIKRELVQALLSSNIESLARQNGHEYRSGPKVSAKAIQDNKSTEAFRLIVDDDHGGTSSEHKIDAVHKALGARVSQVLGQFASRLSKEFP